MRSPATGLTLMGHIMNELARDEGANGAAVGWSTYEASRAQQLGDMDEALFEVAHLVADLTRVDGTVVMTDCLEILGFGVEIAGELPEVLRVARAHDLEGAEREWVRTDRVGTRHRSRYRLCQAVRDALALVVSQDGGLRFIRWHDDGVTYWEQVATGLWEVGKAERAGLAPPPAFALPPPQTNHPKVETRSDPPPPPKGIENTIPALETVASARHRAELRGAHSSCELNDEPDDQSGDDEEHQFAHSRSRSPVTGGTSRLPIAPPDVRCHVGDDRSVIRHRSAS